jgi:hypothetical protein
LGKEWADIQAHTVVGVRLPTDGLFRERLPADEEVVGWPALEDELKAGLQLLGGLEARVAAGLPRLDGGLLAPNPISEVGVGELFQIGMAELVIVHQRAEAALVAVPNVRDEWAGAKEGTVLLEELRVVPISHAPQRPRNTRQVWGQI